MCMKPPLMIAIALALSSTARAAEPHLLAHSAKMGVEVYAMPQASGAWCVEALDLQVRMQPDSSLLPDGASDLMPKLAPVFASECKTAKSAKVTPLIVKDNTTKPVGQSFSINGASGWQKVALAEPAKVAPVAPTPAADTVATIERPAVEQKVATTVEPIQEVPKDLTTASDSIKSAGVTEMPAASSMPVASAQPTPVDAAPAHPDISSYPELDWWRLALARAHFKPELRGNKATYSARAYSEDCAGFGKVARNELDLQDFVSKYKAKTDQIVERMPERMHMSYNVQIDDYDQDRQGFPIKNGNSTSYSFMRQSKRENRCIWGLQPQLDNAEWPHSFDVGFEQDTQPGFLPMPIEDARAFLSRKNGNRTVQVEMLVDVISLNTVDNGWHKTEMFVVRPAWINFRDNTRSNTLLASVNSKELDAARLANETRRKLLEAKNLEEERALQARRLAEMRERAMQQREQQLVYQIQHASPADRAGFMSLPTFNGMSSSGEAIMRGLKSGKPQNVSLLVQADKSGTKDIPVAWPGRLILDAEDGSVPDFKSGHWYVIQGNLTTESDGDNQINGRINVTQVAACEIDACAEYADEKLVISKIKDMARIYAEQAYPDAK